MRECLRFIDFKPPEQKGKEVSVRCIHSKTLFAQYYNGVVLSPWRACWFLFVFNAQQPCWVMPVVCAWSSGGCGMGGVGGRGWVWVDVVVEFIGVEERFAIINREH